MSQAAGQAEIDKPTRVVPLYTRPHSPKGVDIYHYSHT